MPTIFEDNDKLNQRLRKPKNIVAVGQHVPSFIKKKDNQNKERSISN